MRGLKRLHSVQTISTGHALIQNIRRGHYELAVGTDPRLRLAAAFTELAAAVWPPVAAAAGVPRFLGTQQFPAISLRRGPGRRGGPPAVLLTFV